MGGMKPVAIVKDLDIFEYFRSGFRPSVEVSMVYQFGF